MWDLETCFRGTRAYADHNKTPFSHEHHRSRFLAQGREIAGGLFFAAIMTTADLKQNSDVWGLENCNKKINPCQCCKATFKIRTGRIRRDGTLVEKDAPTKMQPYYFGPDGAVFNQLRTLEEWEALEIKPHKIWAERLGLNRFSVKHDFPHAVSLGAGQHLGGSVFESLVKNPGQLPGGTIDERVMGLGLRIRNAYAYLKTPSSERVPYFSRKLWDARQYPELNTKAAITKHLLFATDHVLTALDLPGEDAKLMRVAVRSSVQMYKVIDSQPMRMAPREIEMFKASTLKVCQATVSLSQRAQENGDFLFLVTMKLHYYIHIAQQAEYINPKYSAVLGDEDYVGRISKLVFACSKGRGPTRCAGEVMSTYLRLMMGRLYSKFKSKWSVGT